MGALQAQDFRMAKLAVGVRCPGSSEKTVEDAVSDGKIIRVHALRPTWHFIAAEDARWILDLTAPRIRSVMRSRHAGLELTDKTLPKIFRITEKALTRDGILTVEDMAEEFYRARIKTDNNRFWHIMLCAELEQIVCSGPVVRGKPTFALFDERIRRTKKLLKDESLAKLAQRYFTAHGPATLRDFVWWSGLTVKDARRGLEAVQQNLLSVTANSMQYWFTEPRMKPDVKKPSVNLLPAFDEYIIGYADRSDVISSVEIRKIVSSNGIFRPVIVVNGQVTGTWRKRVCGGRVSIETGLLHETATKSKKPIEEKTSFIRLFFNGKE
jgi:hypothetical protein